VASPPRRQSTFPGRCDREPSRSPELGDWDAAEEELTQAIASGELAEQEDIARLRAELAALPADATTAETMFEGLRDARASEEAQDQASVSSLEAVIAAARGQLENALHHVRRALAHGDALGIGRLGDEWALAARRLRGAGHCRP
jgi:hypothetical protein